MVPSVPGFGLSGSPKQSGINNASVAELWYSLMTQELGYSRFSAGGGDIGSGVTRYLALNHPESLFGIHLTDIGIIRNLMVCTDEKALSEEEKQYRTAATAWISNEGGIYLCRQQSPGRWPTR